MTLIELWYFIGIGGAAIAGVTEGYKCGGFGLAILGAFVGLAIAVGTMFCSVLPNLIASKFVGDKDASEVSDQTFAPILLLFAASVFATPITAVWLTALAVQWIGKW